MDLSKLSESELQALASGDMSKVSDKTLAYLAGGDVPVQKEKSLLEVPAVGLGEAAMQMGTGMGASAYGGLKGLYDIVTGKGLDAAAQDIAEAQQKYTYQPRTEHGRVASEMAALPMELASKGAAWNLGLIGQLFGGDQGRLVGESTGQALPAVVGTLAMGKAPINSVSEHGMTYTGSGLPHVPVVSDFMTGMRDVFRTRNQGGINKLAQEAIQKLVPEAEREQNIAALLGRSADSVVPGSPVTAADAIAAANRQAEMAGSPERFGGQIVALQEAIGKTPEATSQLHTIAQQRKIARQNVLDEGAGSDATYKALDAVRDANAKVNYGQLKDILLQADSELNSFIRRPAMQEALKYAKNIADQRGDKFTFGTFKEEVVVPARTNPYTGVFEPERVIPAELPKISAETMHNVKLALDKAISDPVTFPIQFVERREIIKTRNQLVDWLDKKSEAYEFAHNKYAIDSVPINQMDLWRVLRGKMIAPTGAERAGVYLKALQDENKLIREATGFKHGEEITSIFDAKNSALAERLATELENELYKTQLAKEVNLQGAVKPTEGMTPQLPNLLMRETVVANFLLRTLAKDANAPVNIAAAKILADPKMTAHVLMLVRPKARKSFLKTIKEISTGAGITATTMAGEDQGQQQ